jgi:hypothetical protein
MRAARVVLICGGLWFSGAIVACSDDTGGRGSPKGDDAGAAADAAFAGDAQPVGPQDAGPVDVPDGDSGHDAGSRGDSYDDAATDAPNDAQEASTGPNALAITSPSAIPRIHNEPEPAACRSATPGLLGIFDHQVLVGGQPVIAPDAIVCSRVSAPGATTYEWDVADGVRQQKELQGTPINATWAGFVTFHQSGDYLGTMAISLLESDMAFASIACSEDHFATPSTTFPRGDATVAEAAICESSTAPWKGFGTLKVRFIGGAPQGAFYPAGGATPVTVTFFSL